MTHRISDERLEELIAEHRRIVELAGCKGDLEVTLALLEAKQSRALITELRALAERIYKGDLIETDNDAEIARQWATELQSMVSAHTEAKP